jgi:sterol desaturase/sphingolipid hydroxylase (fatty acid hydroxylase superfamily)
VGYFLSYEWLHWSYHQPAGHWVHRVPGLRNPSLCHTLHHDPRFMIRHNFNITFPIFDRVFGTRKQARANPA